MIRSALRPPSRHASTPPAQTRRWPRRALVRWHSSPWPLCAPSPPARTAARLAATTPTSVVPVAALTVTTPFPDIETQPGSTVSSTSTWPARRRRRSTSPSTACPTAGRRRCAAAGSSSTRSRRRPTPRPRPRWRSTSPPTPPPATYPITITGTERRRQSAVDVTLDVAEQVDSGIQVTADFPSLKGEPGERLHLQPHGHQQHARAADVHVRPDGPAGLDGDGVADGRGQRQDGDDRRRRQRAGQGDGDAADDGRRRARTRSTSRSRRPTEPPGKIELTAEVTGAPEAGVGRRPTSGSTCPAGPTARSGCR